LDAGGADMPGVRLDRVWHACAVAAMLAGCVTIHQPAGGDPSFEHAPAASPPRIEGEPGTVRALPPVLPAGDEARATERLARLRDERIRTGALADPPVGPGDVIEVAAPQVKELAFVTTRVSGDGIIALPIVGTIHAAGRTEDAIRQDIRTRLGAIMYDPQVSVFVREYRSRRVAVIGAVAKSGLYEPSSQNETIFDMLAMAQGPSTDAARQVVFIPNGAADAGALDALAAGTPAAAPSGRNVEPIVFNLRDMSAATTEVVLTLPVRPGDVIMIPDAGQVFIQGWVVRPGYYKIGQDLTMLAVIAAAGGPMFPADMTAARLIRGGSRGEKQLYDVDLEAVASGRLPDVYVQNGDVIELGATGTKLAVYGLYYFFASVFRVGAAVSVL
jgi:polysaccharide biosynthesis/export protein